MMTKIKPLGNRVVVQRSKAPTSKGGILLPDSAQEKPKEGHVLAAGPGKLNDSGQLNRLRFALETACYLALTQEQKLSKMMKTT